MPQDEVTIDPAILEEILVHRDVYFAVPETQLDHVLALVEAMDDPHRSVVELIVWGKHSKAEAARVLGYSRQHIHSLWAEAQERLRVDLSEMLQEDRVGPM